MIRLVPMTPADFQPFEEHDIHEYADEQRPGRLLVGGRGG